MEPSQKTYTDAQIERALYRADNHGLLALRRRQRGAYKVVPPKPPSQHLIAFALAAAFLCLAGVAAFWAARSQIVASARCNPRQEACR
jgi:hypothetical protein